MITRLEVDGFKSLRDFAVDLEPFTVFIGPNSAGKSNILDALALLSRLASQPIAEAFKQGRGKSIDQFSRHGSETSETIRFAAEFLAHGDLPPEPGKKLQSRFRYELTIKRRLLRSGAEKLVAREERLRGMRRDEDTWISSHPDFSAYAGYGRGGEDYFVMLEDDRSAVPRATGASSYWPEDLHVPPTHVALSRTDDVDSSLVRSDLERCRMLDLGAAHMGQPSERIDSGELAPDASNLPTALAELPPGILGEIRADLVSLIPGIASFDVTPEGDEIRLDFELSGGERVPARLVSAGTLRILALLAALRMDPRPYVLCVEEPENGIYPGRLRALLALLRDVTATALPTQTILTTHSPVALAALRPRPQHLRFVDMVRRGGERVTRVRNVGKPGAEDRGRGAISPREIDLLLEAVQSEEPA
jgi:predicted ATPase